MKNIQWERFERNTRDLFNDSLSWLKYCIWKGKWGILEKFLLCKKYPVRAIREEHERSINQRDATVRSTMASRLFWHWHRRRVPEVNEHSRIEVVVTNFLPPRFTLSRGMHHYTWPRIRLRHATSFFSASKFTKLDGSFLDLSNAIVMWFIFAERRRAKIVWRSLYYSEFAA